MHCVISMRQTNRCRETAVECRLEDISEDPRQDSPPFGASGACRVRTHRFRPGLILTIRTTGVPAQTSTHFHIKDAPVMFGFLVRGANRCQYTQGALERQSIVHSSGSNGIRYLPDSAGNITHMSDDTLCMVNIMVAPDVLARYVGDLQLPDRLHNVLKKPKTAWVYWQGRDTPLKRSILAQILQCAYTGPMQALYLESKALELLSCQLDDYVRSQTCPAYNGTPLSRADTRRIRDARDILLHDLENPPSITELARQVGINTCKLKQGFRQVFDNSVFGYFRSYRLDKARELLEQGDHNVTQAAMSIGYNSLSHFSRAFSNRFGMSPKEYLHAKGRRTD